MTAPSTHLLAGQLSAVLEGSELRDVRLAGVPVLDGVYVAVRDVRWNTIPGEVLGARTEVTRAGQRHVLRVRHCENPINFEWSGTIDISDNALSFEMVGRALSTFEVNRVGFALLHPLELVGTAFSARTPDTTLDLKFSETICPWQPATDLIGLEYAAGGSVLRIDFKGELFEMEDHRNWSDAGWKTYCTPLRRAHPTVLRPGDEVRQSVHLSALAGAHGDGRQRESWNGDLRVGAVTRRRYPSYGLTVGVGNALHEHVASIVASHRPSYLHVGTSGVRDEELTAVGMLAELVNVPFTATLAISHDDLPSRVQALAKVLPRLRGVTIVDESDGVTPPGAVRSARRALRVLGCAASVGGGSAVHFAELNRMKQATTDWDYISFSITPQVHHTGDRDVMRTTLAQPYLVRDAKRIGQGSPVVVDTVALRPRLRPDLPARPDDTPDAREREPFGCAWLVATAAGLDRSARLAFLLDMRVGDTHDSPQLETFGLITTFSELPRCSISTDSRYVAVLATPHGHRTARVIAANTTADHFRGSVNGVRLSLRPYEVRLLKVDTDWSLNDEENSP